MDGAPVAERLDGTAITLDPGKHKFTFEIAGRAPIEKEYVILISQKERRESITATSTSDGWFGTNLAVKQTLLKRALSVTLRLSNLLGPRTQHSTSQGPGFLNRSSYRTEGLTVSLAVSYNFNNFKFNQSMQAGEGIEQGGGGGAGGPQH